MPDPMPPQPRAKTHPADLDARLTAPDAVADLAQVRAGIDTVDAEIIALLALRLDYVRAAAQFKPDLAAIPAPLRVREMLDARALWAQDLGLPPDFVAPLFAQISEWFIRQQTAHWTATNGHAPAATPKK